MPTNDVVLPDESVPEIAAVLIDRGAYRFVLRDASEGALQIDGERPETDEIALKDGSIIRLGSYRLRLNTRFTDSIERIGSTNVLSGRANEAVDAFVRGQGERKPLNKDRPFNIGSADDNDLKIEDDFVSGYHCRISNRGGRWILSDLESTNGTIVNGMRVSEAELPMPATITVGRATLLFEAAHEAHASPHRNVFHGMIGTTSLMQTVFRDIERMAPAKEPILIFGESGCGKELIARALHDLSDRRNGPYLALNCGALNGQLVESELFGHIKGAFTGAQRDKMGAFEATSGGTLFLDEVGELPLDLQPKLLRVLETSTVRAVGGTKEVPVDARIVSATNKNLQEMVDQGTFREDLFHRLLVLSVYVPPLRQRPEDIIAIAEHFVKSLASRPVTLAIDAQKALENYDWPGNVRELRNVIVRALLMTDGDALRATDLRFTKDAFSRPHRDARRALRNRDANERERIISTLAAVNGNKTEAARVLRMSKSTFYDRLRRYGISNRENE